MFVNTVEGKQVFNMIHLERENYLFEAYPDVLAVSSVTCK